jgi:erythromycin esterase-like protein
MKPVFFLSFLFLVFTSQAQDYSWLNSKISKIENIAIQNSNFDDLQSLKKAIGEAEIVFLGEHSHGEGNEFEAKARLVRFLHEEMDFDIIAFESGFYDLWQANKKIKEGIPVSEAINNSVFNIWTQSQEFQPLVRYLSEHKKEFEFVGFDNQLTSTYSLSMVDDLQVFLQKHSTKLNQDDVDEFEKLVDDFSNNDLTDDFDTEKFDLLLQKINKRISLVSNTIEEKEFWQQNFKSFTTLPSMLKIYTTKTAETWKAKDTNIRDAQMADNLLFVQKIYPNKKIICWGATGHFANNITTLEDEKLDECQPMGSHIKNTLGEGKVFILAPVTSQGSYGAVFEEETKLPIPQSNSLEFQLDKMDYDFAFIDVKELNVNFTTSAITHQAVKGNWTQVVDGFLYLKTTKRCTVTHHQTNQTEITKPSSNYFTFTGKIVDKSTKEKLPYVHIFIENTGIGTVSNQNGEFEIKIPIEYKSSRLVFSTITYRTVKKNIGNLKSINLVELPQNETLLKEVLVQAKPITAKSLVLKAINEIKNNYIQKPFNYTLYYRGREFDSLSNEKLEYEAALETYYDKGYAPKGKHSYNIPNKRNLSSKPSKNDKIIMDWPFLGLYTDFILQGSGILNKKLINSYEFHISDTLRMDSSLVYEISFTATKLIKKYTDFSFVKKLKGKIYIQDGDYAIIKLISNFRFKEQKNTKQVPLMFSFETSYKKYDKHYFVSYSIFKSLHILEQQHLISGKHELVVVDINTEKPKPFTNPIFELNKVHYNKEFWESFNGIKK